MCRVIFNNASGVVKMIQFGGYFLLTSHVMHTNEERRRSTNHLVLRCWASCSGWNRTIELGDVYVFLAYILPKQLVQKHART